MDLVKSLPSLQFDCVLQTCWNAASDAFKMVHVSFK